MVYSIKMVGACRGKFRSVGWKNLFKEESFSKNVCRTDSGRVRREARLKARAQEEAEERLGRELKQTKQELEKAVKTKQDIAEDGEYKLKAQEMEARKLEKDLTASHK
jgi:hypothetical protein